MARVNRTTPVAEVPNVYVARTAGVFRVKGKLVHFYRGQTFPADSPLVRMRPDAFRPLTLDSVA